MRRLALAAAAALAACSVKLEGAPCTSDANCPSEQRCDLGSAAMGQCVTCVPDPACASGGTFCVAADDTLLGTCSTNVGGCNYSILTACAAPKVCQGTPGSAACNCPAVGGAAGDGCSGVGAQACDTASGNVLTCVSSGWCRVWQTSTDCASQGLTCKTPAGSPVCACPDNSGDLIADAANGSAFGAAPYPTGLATPTACRFKSLTDALSKAGAGSTVRMTGWTSTSGPITFSAAASGESFPLVVNPGVTLATTDSPLAPEHYLVEVDQVGTTRPVLQLDHDTAASGFTVQPAGSGSAAEALFVNCTAAGSAPVALSDLVLDGKGSLSSSTIGIALRLAGPCSVSASSVTAENAMGTGILVKSSNPPSPASPSAISIAGCVMRGNGDSGLVVDVSVLNGPPSLSVTSNDLTANSASTPYSDATTTRKGGGVVLKGAVPSPLAFTGNKVHGNSYDQVLVWSSGAWDISGGTACGTSSNNFTCYDTANGGVGLSALLGAHVTAGWEYWAQSAPMSGADYLEGNASTITVNSACWPNPLTCP